MDTTGAPAAWKPSNAFTVSVKGLADGLTRGSGRFGCSGSTQPASTVAARPGGGW
jgi:hypothetical protein